MTATNQPTTDTIPKRQPHPLALFEVHMHHRYDERTGAKTTVDGASLRTQRQARAMTMADVARKTGLALSTIHAIETETRWPDDKAIKLLTKHVGMFTTTEKK